MKQFFIQYLHLFGYTICGLIFAFASFYFIVNFYHHQELKAYYVMQPSVSSQLMQIDTKMREVDSNISIHPNRVTNSNDALFLSSFKTKLQSCETFLLNATYLEMGKKEAIGPLDVEHYRQSFQSKVLSSCLIEQFYGMTDAGSTSLGDFQDIAPYVHLMIQNLSSSTSYLEKDLINNSSYFFNSKHARMTVHDKTLSSFQTITSLYNQASDLLVELSRWYRVQVEG